MAILPKPEIDALLAELDVSERLEADKVDIVLLDRATGRLFGVVHVKASFAERRTDDQPMSQALISNGFYSPFWTLDCKAQPAARPYNKGELGEPGKRGAKRKDIEVDGYFSACFSYNSNTVATPAGAEVAAPIVVCNFNDPMDAFAASAIEARERIMR